MKKQKRELQKENSLSEQVRKRILVSVSQNWKRNFSKLSSSWNICEGIFTCELYTYESIYFCRDIITVIQ